MFECSRRHVMRPLSAFSLAVALAFGGFGAVPGLSSKAEAAGFPDKPVQLIVPYRAGGGTDTMARVFAKALSAELGQPVPVVNHKGGGGAVGGSRLKNSTPDGHTILMGGDDIASYIPLGRRGGFHLRGLPLPRRRRRVPERHTVALLVGAGTYVGLLSTAGFVVSSALGLAACLWLGGVRKWWLVAVLSIGLPLALTQILWWGLTIQVPAFRLLG